MADQTNAPGAEADRVIRLGGIPWILWRHLSWELLRVLGVTAGVIVTVIAFGAAAKPLAENTIGADTVLKYVSLAMVPMMQFALPFAAGFAATIVLHRFATDNEIVAMSACGMGYRKIFAPVAILGVVLALVMFLLVAFIVPQFWTRMKELATGDATQVLVAAVRRGEAVTADKMMIYADGVTEVPAPKDTGADRRLLLTGVAAIELARGGALAPATEFTAETAAVDIYTTEAGTLAKLVLAKATIYRPGDGAIAAVPRAEPEAASLDSGFYRGPKFLPLGELLVLRNDVDRAQVVQAAKRPLAALLGEVDMWKCLEAQGTGGTLAFTETGTRRTFTIQGVQMAAGEMLPVAGRQTFTITELVEGRPFRRTEAERASLRAISETGFEPRVALIVPAPQHTQDLAANLPGRWPPRIDDLRPTGCAVTDWATTPSAGVLAAAATIPARDSVAPYEKLRQTADKQAAKLADNRLDVRFESDSHILQRVAQSSSILLVLLLGATLAVAMRRALPLTVYLLAFLPAIANILMIEGGRQAMRDGYLGAGAGVMWGGNAILLLALTAAWLRLRRT